MCNTQKKTYKTCQQKYNKVMGSKEKITTPVTTTTKKISTFNRRMQLLLSVYT